MNRLTTHPQPQGNGECGGMTDAVFPQAILTPAITVIGTDQQGGTKKTTHQGSELLIHPAQAGLLTPGTLNRTAEIATEGAAGGREAGPLRTDMPVRHVGLSDVEKNKQRLISGSLLNPRIDPFQLSLQAPGIAGEVKMLKPLAQLSATGSLAKLSVRYDSDAAELAIASALAANPAPPKCAVQLS